MIAGRAVGLRHPRLSVVSGLFRRLVPLSRRVRAGPGAARQQQPQAPRAQPPGAGRPAAYRHVPRRDQLRRGRRHCHRRARQLRPQPDQRGLRGHGGRKAAAAFRAVARRHPGRAAGCAALLSDQIPPDVRSNHEGVQRPRLRDRARRSADPLRTQRRVRRPPSSSSSAISARTTSPRWSRPARRKDGAQDFTSNRQLLLRRSITSRPEASLRHPRQDRRLLPAAGHNTGAAPRDQAKRSAHSRRATRSSTLRQVSDYLAGVRAGARRSSSSAKGSTTTPTTPSRIATPTTSATR